MLWSFNVVMYIWHYLNFLQYHLFLWLLNFIEQTDRFDYQDERYVLRLIFIQIQSNPHHHHIHPSIYPLNWNLVLFKVNITVLALLLCCFVPYRFYVSCIKEHLLMTKLSFLTLSKMESTILEYTKEFFPAVNYLQCTLYLKLLKRVWYA